MSILKCNSIFDKVFKIEDKVGENKIKVNSGNTERTLSRREIIQAGRIVVASAFQNEARQSKLFDGKVGNVLTNSGFDYLALSENHKKQVLMFCAAIANNAVGKGAPESYEEVSKDPSYFRDANFLRALAAITQDVLRPMLPLMWDDVANDLMTLRTVPVGGTFEINVESNDAFIYEDSAIGSGHSATYQYRYGETIKLRAKSYTAQTKYNWYQSVVNGNIGDWYLAFFRGQLNKMYAIVLDAFITNAADNKYIPSGLTYQGYTSDNWNLAVTKLASVVGVNPSDLVAYGTRNNLAKVLPTDGTGGAITGLMYGLGKEWFERGFLPNAGGVRLLEVPPVVVPGTQNSTVETIDMDDKLYIMAKANRSYAPIVGVMEEGSPFTVELTPDKTADFTFDINSEMRFNVVPVFANKGAVIESVSATDNKA